MITKREITVKSGEIFPIYLLSDIHYDSPLCDRAMLKRDLDNALADNADIWINGDVFDFLLFRDFKRSTPSNQGSFEDDQIGCIIDDVAEFLTPYAKRIMGIGVGNHETSVIKYHGIDPIKMLIHKLMDKTGAKIAHLGYTGFIRYSLARGDSRAAGNVYDIWYHHGTGGAGKSKGILQHNDVASHVTADLYWMGHNHSTITDNDFPRLYVNHQGRETTVNRKFVRTAGYQRDDKKAPEEYLKRGYKLDWGNERFLRKQSKGCQVLKLMYERKQRKGGESTQILSKIEGMWA